MKPVRFDLIKAAAKRQYTRHFFALTIGYDEAEVNASVAALLPFAKATSLERREMDDFARALDAPAGDVLARAARFDMGTVTRRHTRWCQLLLMARETGVSLIEKWDVRQVGKLIELFPECAPRRFRGKALTCYMADDDNSDWMVEVAMK